MPELNNKLKVLSVLWGFSLGGVSKYAVNLHGVNGLNNFNVELKTACIYGTDWECDLVPLKEIDAHLIPIRSRLDFSWVQSVCVLIDDYKPDLLLVHGFNGPVVASVCRFQSRHPFEIVCTYHGLYSAPKSSRRPFVPIVNFIQEQLYRKQAKAIVTVCSFSRKYLVSKKVPNNKLTVIHNGIPAKFDYHDRYGLRSELGLGKEDFIVGVASRLDQNKGVNFLIDSMPSLLEIDNRIKLVIFGQGSCEIDLMAQVEQLGISGSVYFGGYKADIPKWLNIFDIYVLPSLAESHSIGLLEAMRAGLPIVATNVGGNPESIINGVSGIIVPPRDSESFTKAIATCVRNKSLCQKLGMQARERFYAEFTLDRQLRRTAEWLLSVAE